MLSIEKVDLQNKAQVQRFIQLPFRLYAGHPQWVPPFISDVQLQLNPAKHPFYEHSDIEFFLAVRDGRTVGRIAALEIKPYNQYHNKRQGQFYFFECEDDLEAADRLFSCVFDWAHRRGLDHIVGPKGLSSFDGYGILVEGFEHRQMMTMMNYNYPYYSRMVETIGFTKEVDFVSCYLSRDNFNMPDRLHRIAERALARGSFQVKRFSSKAELRSWANRIGIAYNKTFINNWEYYPLSDNEVKFVLDNLMQVLVPQLVKIITYDDDVVGFLLAFPDVSPSLQRANGRLLPHNLVDLLVNMNRTPWVSLNGAGILPEFQGRGGNALMYSEMEKTIKGSKFKHAELTQVAETAVQMRNDLINVGGKAYKNHRVYTRKI